MIEPHAAHWHLQKAENLMASAEGQIQDPVTMNLTLTRASIHTMLAGLPAGVFANALQVYKKAELQDQKGERNERSDQRR